MDVPNSPRAPGPLKSQSGSCSPVHTGSAWVSASRAVHEGGTCGYTEEGARRALESVGASGALQLRPLARTDLNSNSDHYNGRLLRAPGAPGPGAVLPASFPSV